MSDFDRTLTLLPQALQSGVAVRWRDFTAAAERTGVAPPVELVILEQLVKVWAGSDFVASACSLNPRLLKQLLDSGDLVTSYAEGDYSRRLNEWLEGVADEDQLGTRLRRFRRREMVRIAWRDLAGLVPLTETLTDLSELADVALESALQRLYKWQCQRFGTPRDAQGKAQQLVVLGMGKLGGRELNFSSDIDLIFTFPSHGETDGRPAISNEAFFRRLGQRLIKILHEPTAEGFVFRVDMRLRPFGDSGPLVIPFNAMVDYYQNHGREWERYAMIKARVCAGDRQAGQHLLLQLRPFVYRRYLDYGAFEALRTMKAMIAKEVERKGLQRNIKLGPGGIREIEFIGQAFQLIYGGREPALRERSLLRVLDYLGESERLPPYAVTVLTRAYEFLRRIENRLQAWTDQQTHELPKDELARLRLAYAMGYPDWNSFLKALSHHVRGVSNQFEQVFAAPQAELATSRVALDFTAIWSGEVTQEDAIQFLAEKGFDDPAKALVHLQALKQSFNYRALSRRGKERMDKLIPLLLGAVAIAPQPAITLERIFHLLETIARRSVYLVLLVENPLVLSQLVKLCAASSWIAKCLSRYPLLLDDLLDPASLYHPPERARLGEELSRYLEQVSSDDAEQVMDALRHFKQTQVLRVAAADISGAMPLMVVSDHLSEIAEVLLRQVLSLAWADLTPRFGRPRCVVDGENREAALAIVAYGKLGGIELNYGSDLDLVFLHDSEGNYQYTDGLREIDNPTFFARLVQRIIHFLTTRTGAGDLYEVDTRLRPSGRAGLLVSSLAAFAEYQHNQAWTWEHQALVRARVVAGPTGLTERFNVTRREVLGRQRDPEVLRQEVRQMRERMRTELGCNQPGYFHLKQDRGGIADIEFMVQYMILANAYQYPELLTYTDNIRQLDGLERFGILTAEDATLLRHAYRGLRRRVHMLTLQEQPALVPEEEMRDYRDGVTRLWQQLMESDRSLR
jgi:glutamate-ammonia-ligase adenylyltransferase